MAIKQLFLLTMGLSVVSSYCQEKECSMSTSVFIPPGDFSLQMRAVDVPASEILSVETQSMIDQMFLVARGERDDTGENRVMVGLAAPQIGYSKRIILVDIGVDSDRKELGSLIAYINPEITWYSDEIVKGREGCYSVDSCVVGIVPRSEKIHIKALDRSGMPISAEFSGFTARIFQHEIDHLNGIRFPDRVGSEGKLHWVEESEYADYKKDCENWNCECPWATWVAMKNGEPYGAPIKQSQPFYTYQQQDQKYFIGFELRTNNQECSSAMPMHKEKFFRENIPGKIPNKTSGDILALYTDYEGDLTGDYSWILGCEVSSLDEVPQGLVGKVIPASKYAVFTTKGAFPQGLIAAWQEVWKSDLARSYTSDFEVYRSDFDPQTNPEIMVYIAVE